MTTTILELLAASAIVLALYLALTPGRALFQIAADYRLWRRHRQWQKRRRNG